jgi:redox-sensitive bicupin YhaK (pirin superfamily)
MLGGPFAHELRGYDVYEAGHPIRRLLPSRERSMVGPFVLFDHFGPVRLAPGQGVEIAAHGHAHLATITTFFSGASLHADDLGNRVVVEAGAVAWMHAGSGIVHAERTPDDWRAHGGVGHGIQAWVALPEELEMSAPRFQLARPDDIPQVVVGGAILRVLVGEMRGARSPIETCSPVLFAEARTAAEAAEIPLEPIRGARAVFFATGVGALNGARVEAGTLVALHDGDAAVLRLEPDTIALIFGGAPLGRRYMEGNVIASSEARLDATLLALCSKSLEI